VCAVLQSRYWTGGCWEVLVACTQWVEEHDRGDSEHTNVSPIASGPGCDPDARWAVAIARSSSTLKNSLNTRGKEQRVQHRTASSPGRRVHPLNGPLLRLTRSPFLFPNPCWPAVTHSPSSRECPPPSTSISPAPTSSSILAIFEGKQFDGPSSGPC